VHLIVSRTALTAVVEVCSPPATGLSAARTCSLIATAPGTGAGRRDFDHRAVGVALRQLDIQRPRRVGHPSSLLLDGWPSGRVVSGGHSGSFLLVVQLTAAPAFVVKRGRLRYAGPLPCTRASATFGCADSMILQSYARLDSVAAGRTKKVTAGLIETPPRLALAGISFRYCSDKRKTPPCGGDFPSHFVELNRIELSAS
jgi:hypothetical protein